MKVLVSVLLMCLAVVTNASPRIVGGHDAPEGKYPYQVSLRYGGSHFCGGSIINERWILTAAHCLINKSPSNVEVYAGSNKLQAGESYIYMVEYLTIHENFSLDHVVNDIGLIRVAAKIGFSKQIQPIALTSVDISKADTPAVLSGWGRLQLGGEVPNNLQEIDLKIISQERCNQSWSSMITESHICTLTKLGQGTCNGDSGGPLVVDKVQVGIVSFGKACAGGDPDVFTRVYTFRDWIQQQQDKFY